jgi:small nuclear ribonucleoprotein (snRNP)-like protein
MPSIERILLYRKLFSFYRVGKIPTHNTMEKTKAEENLPTSEALEELKTLLGRSLRVLISDGRVVEGEFQCMDKDLNFILGGATEYYGLKDKRKNELDVFLIPFFHLNPALIATTNDINSETIIRNLGMAMIPGKHVVKVFLNEGPEAKEEV